MSTIERTLISQLLDALSGYRLEPGRALLAAYSGGPDSTALLELLYRAKLKGLLTRNISALYVNHHLRSQSELSQELQFVESYCSRRSIPLTAVDLGEQAVYTRCSECGESVEEAARILRYEALEHYCDQEAVLTAHTRDDQVETLLMRVFSGSGIEGLTGIPEQREPFYRPLIHTPKSMLMQFLEEQGITFSNDSTNRTGVYLRNQLREIIPEISRVFPGFQRALDALQQKMTWAEASFPSQTPVPECVKPVYGGGGIEFPLSWFCSCAPYERMMRLYEFWNRYLKSDSLPLPFDSIKPFLLWCEAGCPEDVTPVFDVFQGIIEVKGDRVLWKRAVAQKEKKGYLKAVAEGDTRLFGGVYLCVRESDRFTPETLGLVQDEISPPLVVRSFKAGDMMISTGGRKAVSKLFSDWKVPRSMRWMIPVIEDRRGIQAVLGSAFGYHDRAAAIHTRTIEGHEQYLLMSLEIIGSEN